ncbi:MAG: molybdate ABC transporter substrate-binding protein [Dehalococcoidales bacterium]|nr:molybdate ABC transporter substrate-binding protein [Dehalococcoidales bacterium]
MRVKNILSILVLLASILLVIPLAGCSSQSTTTTSIEAVELNVSAAASLTDALQAVNEAYMQKNSNIKVIANFASSGTLQKQIEQGAPADVFLSAAAKQMDALQAGGLIIDNTRQNLLNNRVVLVVPVNSTLNISSFTDLLNSDVEKIGIGDPESVPAGTYGKQALDQLGIYEKVESKLILCSDVRQVLGYVEAGNVDVGIVYSTDAAISDKVNISADAPVEVNSKIVYPVAVIKDSKKVDAAGQYIGFLSSKEAISIFEEYGFSAVNR